MENKPLNVLFLCTGNSARSIFAEALINHYGKGQFRGYSAGSHPKGEVHPTVLDLIRRFDLPEGGLRSKSWDEFARPGALKMDFVFTVCDKAAAEACPVWPGQPMTAHWGVPDPVVMSGEDHEKMIAFRQAFRELENRIKIFVSLPFESLDTMKLQQALNEIGGCKVQETESNLVD
jgi:arsenate reductase